jgi:hypothetical protein
MYYYLDTNALYNLKKFPVTLLPSTFTSFFALIELVSGITDQKSFSKRKGALKLVFERKVTIKWDLTDKLIFESFDFFNDLEFVENRIGPLNDLILAILTTDDYEIFRETKVFGSEFGLGFFRDLDDRVSNGFIKASIEGIKRFKQDINADPEQNTVEYNNISYVLDNSKAVNDFFNSFPEINRAITILSLSYYALDLANGNSLDVESVFKSYNGNINIFVDTLSKFSIDKLTQKNLPGKNDYADLLHVIYLESYENINMISDDKLFANYLSNQSMPLAELTVKKSYLSGNHSGIQPIRVLQHNLIHGFENTNPDFLSESLSLITKTGLQPGINYYALEEAILYSTSKFKSQTPYVDLDKKIALHETFLSYMWIVCYSMFVLYDEAVAKPMQNQQSNKMVNVLDPDAISQAKKLLYYGRSLIKFYSPWDKRDLPNPEEYSLAEDFYITRANSLFVFSVNFILCHEYAHVEKSHVDQYYTADDLQRKNFEIEADNRAIELLLKGRNGQNDKSLELGILMGLSALLFFGNSSSGGKVHPDTDNRIKNYLEQLNAPLEAPIWGMAALFFRIWDEQFNLNFSWPSMINDFKELFYDVLKQVNSKKIT